MLGARRYWKRWIMPERQALNAACVTRQRLDGSGTPDHARSVIARLDWLPATSYSMAVQNNSPDNDEIRMTNVERMTMAEAGGPLTLSVC